MAALAALTGMTVVLALLAWRGMKAAPGGELSPELVWRQATEEDLF
jgi:hypothetical protein